MMKKSALLVPVLSVFCFISVSCESLRTAVFDQYSYQQSIEIKVKSSQLLDKATSPYSENEERIDDLLLELDKIMEYESHRSDNDISLEMWKILTDEEKNLLGGFLRRWKEEGGMSRVFVEEAKSQIIEAMDLIIAYEAKKEKETKNRLMDLISQY